MKNEETTTIKQPFQLKTNIKIKTTTIYKNYESHAPLQGNIFFLIALFLEFFFKS